MNKQEFDTCIAMLRSGDPMTFEDGYWSLVEHVHQFVDKLIQLMQAEQEPQMRARFIELLGDAKNPKVVPLLAAELKRPDREVRFWAILSLRHFGDPKAERIAEDHHTLHPEDGA